MLPLLRFFSGVDGIGVNSSCMTIELCGYIAQNQGFTYFGVEAGTSEQQGCCVHAVSFWNLVPPICMYAVCFAGDDGNLATSQGQSSSCTSTCARDPSEMCGGWVGGLFVFHGKHVLNIFITFASRYRL